MPSKTPSSSALPVRSALLFVYLVTMIAGGHPVPWQVHGAPANELLDLSCYVAEDCRDFAVPAFDILAQCVQKQCVCSNGTVGATASTLPCRPSKTWTSNLIGMSCPCDLNYTECTAGRCVCAANFMPSPDRRRCLPNLNATCTSDTECQRRTAHSNCLHSRCLCNPGYVPSADHTACLQVVKYMNECRVNEQCQALLGAGGRCDRLGLANSSVTGDQLPGRCDCDSVDTLVAAIAVGNDTRYLCENRKAIDDQCTTDADCRNHGDAEQPPKMTCYLAQCICDQDAGFVAPPLPDEGAFDDTGDRRRYCVARSRESRRMFSAFGAWLEEQFGYNSTGAAGPAAGRSHSVLLLLGVGATLALGSGLV